MWNEFNELHNHNHIVTAYHRLLRSQTGMLQSFINFRFRALRQVVWFCSTAYKHFWWVCRVVIVGSCTHSTLTGLFATGGSYNWLENRTQKQEGVGVNRLLGLTCQRRRVVVHVPKCDWCESYLRSPKLIDTFDTEIFYISPRWTKLIFLDFIFYLCSETFQNSETEFIYKVCSVSSIFINSVSQ
jgi:hypothetical protein